MIAYRPRKSIITEEIKQIKQFETEREMKKYITEEWGGSFSIEDIVLDCTTQTNKDIIWSNIGLIKTKRMRGEDYIELYGEPQCIGYYSIQKDETKDSIDTTKLKTYQILENRGHTFSNFYPLVEIKCNEIQVVSEDLIEDEKSITIMADGVVLNFNSESISEIFIVNKDKVN